MKTQGRKGPNDNERQLMARREVLRALGVGAGVAAVPSTMVEQARAQGVTDAEKRKARYQANSADVQNYYRVNRYPR